MISRGMGFEKDLEQAYYWVLIAENNVSDATAQSVCKLSYKGLQVTPKFYQQKWLLKDALLTNLKIANI